MTLSTVIVLFVLFMGVIVSIAGAICGLATKIITRNAK